MTRPVPPLPARWRALVTGGAGFIGSHLTELLLARGHRVTVFDDLSTGCLDNLAAARRRPGLRFVEGTVLDAGALAAVVAEHDVVFHLAATVGVELVLADPLRMLETNVLGTSAVLEAARLHGCRVLLASSSEVYGKSQQVPLAEDSDRLLGPVSNVRWSYSSAKAIDEHLGLACWHQLGVPVVVARLFNTIGPRQTGRYGMVVPRLVAQALAGEPLTVHGDGRQTRSFCDVLDTVEALAALVAHPRAPGVVVNVGADREISILELAATIAAAVGLSPADAAERIRQVPYSEAYGPGFEDMRRRVPELERIRRLLGWQAKIPLQETLARIIAAHREAALLPAAASHSIPSDRRKRS